MPDDHADSSEQPPSQLAPLHGGPSATPRDLQVKLSEQRLTIDWSDGAKSEFSLAELRRHCPCATCRNDREQQDPNPLKILKADPTDLRATEAKLVGNYAIRFTWSDGHDAGIFDFRQLRALKS